MSNLSQTFNHHANILQNAIALVNGIDVLQEPLLLQEKDGAYFVHERSGPKWLYEAHGIDDVEIFDENDLNDRHGSDLMTLDEYENLHDILDANRIQLDELTRSQMMFMSDRLEEIQDDLDDHGYTITAPATAPGMH